MSRFAIGIDFGTSTSEVAIFRSDNPECVPDPITKIPVVPSLVAVDSRGRVLIGEDARTYVDRPGYGVREVKRLLGTGEKITLGGASYDPSEIAALIIGKVKHNAEVFLGEPVTRAVLSVPANSNDAARQATLRAAELAGLEATHLINEPTAAALSFGIQHVGAEEQIVVFDFGGGTLDVSILEMMEGVLEVKCSYGDTKLGGKDFDEIMMDLVLRKFRREHPSVSVPDESMGMLKAQAEKAKMALSERESCTVAIPRFAGEIDLDVDISRQEYETAVVPLLDRARECLMTAMKIAHIMPSSVTRVLLVGGTTYMPCVMRIVQSVFGREFAARAVNPDLAVALGAATCSAMREGMVDPEQSIVHSDVCAMGLGIDAFVDVDGVPTLMYTSLIKPNTLIPFSRRYNYSLRRPDQDEVEFHVFQTYLPDENFPLALGLEKGLLEDIGYSGMITDIPPSLGGIPHPLLIEFSYDDNGIVQIRAEIPGLKKGTKITFAHNKLRMSDDEAEQAREKLRALLEGSQLGGGSTSQHEAPPDEGPESGAWRAHPRAQYLIPLINRAEKLAIEIPDRSGELRNAVAKLKQALSAGDEASVEAARDELTDLLYEIQN